MLNFITNLKRKKQQRHLEKKAQSLWYGGFLTEDDWPDEVIPFWCHWLETGNHKFNFAWCRIQNELFWKTAFPILQGRDKLLALEIAGHVGNLVVFGIMSGDDISQYAYETIRNFDHRIRIVHPKAILWMKKNGYWDNNNIEDLMDVYIRKDRAKFSVFEVYGISKMPLPTKDFALLWYTSLFRDLDLSSNTKANILGGLLQARELFLDTHIMMEAISPHLDDIDLELLYTSYNVTALIEKDQADRIDPNLVNLYQSLSRVVQYEKELGQWQCPPNFEIEPILGILIDLQPIQCPLDLYKHAVYVKTQILQPQTLEYCDFSSALLPS